MADQDERLRALGERLDAMDQQYKSDVARLIESLTAVALEKIREAGATAIQHAAALRAMRESPTPAVSAQVLDPVLARLQSLRTPADHFRDALQDSSNELEEALNEVIDTGDSLVGDVVTRVDDFVTALTALSDGVNSQIGESFQVIVPEQLSESFDAFGACIADADSAVGRIESVLDGELGRAVELVGVVVDIVEPVLPALEAMEQLT